MEAQYRKYLKLTKVAYALCFKSIINMFWTKCTQLFVYCNFKSCTTIQLALHIWYMYIIIYSQHCTILLLQHKLNHPSTTPSSMNTIYRTVKNIGDERTLALLANYSISSSFFSNFHNFHNFPYANGLQFSKIFTAKVFTVLHITQYYNSMHLNTGTSTCSVA